MDRQTNQSDASFSSSLFHHHQSTFPWRNSILSSPLFPSFQIRLGHSCAQRRRREKVNKKLCLNCRSFLRGRKGCCYVREERGSLSSLINPANYHSYLPAASMFLAAARWEARSEKKRKGALLSRSPHFFFLLLFRETAFRTSGRWRRKRKEGLPKKTLSPTARFPWKKE